MWGRRSRFVRSLCFALALCLPAPVLAGIGGDAAQVARLLAAVNQARAEAGLAPVSPHAGLSRAAEEHADAMARAGDLSVEAVEGQGLTDRALAARYPFQSLYHMVAVGRQAPEQLLARWRGASSRGGMLLARDVRDIGVGVRDSGGGRRYWALVLGRSAEPLAAPPTVRATVLRHINAFRLDNGLPPLAPAPALDRAAQTFAEEMARHDRMSHTGVDGSSIGDRVTRAGYRWSTVAENLGQGYPDPASLVRGWIDSPGHRRNLLRPEMTEAGIGVTERWIGARDRALDRYWALALAAPG